MTATKPRVTPNKQNAPASEHEEEMVLLKNVADQDRLSFHELHKRFAPVLFSAIYRILNNQEDAEDVTQEVFHQIWVKAHLYDRRRGRPLTWAVTMARNKAIDRLRSKQRRYRLRNDVENESKLDDWQTDLSSADEVYAKERHSIIRHAVRELSDEQRQAIEMAYFGGLTQNEIADVLGQPLGTIKARIRRGMIKLRGIVSPRL